MAEHIKTEDVQPHIDLGPVDLTHDHEDMQPNLTPDPNQPSPYVEQNAEFPDLFEIGLLEAAFPIPLDEPGLGASLATAGDEFVLEDPLMAPHGAMPPEHFMSMPINDASLGRSFMTPIGNKIHATRDHVFGALGSSHAMHDDATGNPYDYSAPRTHVVLSGSTELDDQEALDTFVANRHNFNTLPGQTVGQYDSHINLNDSENIADTEHERADLVFAELEADYNAKKLAKSNTIQDDIRFKSAANEERLRLERRKASQAPIASFHEDHLSQDSLFIPEAPCPPATDGDDVLMAEPHLPPGYAPQQPLFTPETPASVGPHGEQPLPTEPRLPENYVTQDSLFTRETPIPPQSENTLTTMKRKRAAPKPLNRLSTKENREAMATGIKSGFAQAGRGRRKPRDPSRPSQKRSKTGAGRKKRPEISNIQTLGRTNIIEAAQANASKPSMPTFTATRKAEALAELLSSIPSSDRATCASDKVAVLEATKKFNGHGAVKSDGNGGWKLRGMESSLYHHQLLGTAFLRDRENGGQKPLGGLVCDEMGFGKTIQMIANIVNGKPEEGHPVKTTLIVAPPSLLDQWLAEMEKHVSGRNLGRILRYHSNSRRFSNDALGELKGYDVILTTYQEVQKSYPTPLPPKHLVTEEKKNEWWEQFYRENVGHLHQIKYHRVVLDEAQSIKNHRSKTSIAVRALTANFRWAITGTPISNSVEEFFAYFAFLRVPHTGDFDTFANNYCNHRKNKTGPAKLERLHNILRAIMLRRTHDDTLFNAPIVSLPGITLTTHQVKFNEVERAIYQMVKTRYVHEIKRFSSDGTIHANHRNILGMFNNLRMLCAHVLLCQALLKEIFTASDVERLWRLTAKEVTPADDDSRQRLIVGLRGMLQQSPVSSGLRVSPAPPVSQPEATGAGASFGLSFKFRRFLRSLSKSQAWAELHLRSTCVKCRLPPDDPICTNCFHVYCQECINSMDFDRHDVGQETITCVECNRIIDETSPCAGLKELGYNSAETAQRVQQIQEQRVRRVPGASTSTRDSGDVDWIEMEGIPLPSAKLSATKAAILNWREQSPDQKIIIYTQYLGVVRILSKVCEAEGWDYVTFTGKMTFEGRERAKNRFAYEPHVSIMISSLKAGGVGLNLTMASKVIILDLWFNTAVEAQAYCRAFRMGQTRPVEVLRFVVENSIDEALVKMQDRKDVEINGAIGRESLGKRATVNELLELFGPLTEEDDQNEFILVEDEHLNTDNLDVDPTDRLPPRPF